MLTRRVFVSLLAASTLSAPALRAEEGFFGKLKSGWDWFVGLVTEAPTILEHIYDWLLRAKAGYRILVDSRNALDDIRRKLADPSTDESLRSKLRAWLKTHDKIVAEAPRHGERREDFAARQQKEFELLKTSWNSLKKDAVEALYEIGRLQDEIESIDPQALNGDEHRLFKSLLEQKKKEEEFLDEDSPPIPW